MHENAIRNWEARGVLRAVRLPGSGDGRTIILGVSNIRPGDGTGPAGATRRSRGLRPRARRPRLASASPRRGRLRAASEMLIVALVSGAVGAAAALTRGWPTTKSDPGIFLSVAGRLLQGDRLYRDVFDNKDPLFYYADAAALWLLGWRGPFLLDIVWLALAGFGAYLLLRALTGEVGVAVFGLLLYPLLITQINYYSGYTETSALALLPLLAYLVYVRKPVLAGCLGAVLFFLKVTVIPVVAVIGLVGFGLTGATPRKRAQGVLAFIATAAAAGGVILLVLVLRGEAGAYLATLRENRTYASHALTVEGWPPGLRGHLRVIRAFLPDRTRDFALALLAFVVVLVVASVEVRARLRQSRLLVLTLAVWLSTLLVLAATALWDQHLEVLAFPLLTTAALALVCARTAARRWSRRVEMLAIGVVAGGCLVAAAWTQHPIEILGRWNDGPTANVSAALEQVADATDVRRRRVPYAHLGGNDDQGAGAFLDGSFRLACARFHQYPFTPAPALRTTMQCLQRNPSLLVAVTPLFSIDSYTYWHRPTPSAWRWFVRVGEAYLNSHCRLLQMRPTVRVYRCNREAARASSATDARSS